MAAVVLGNVFSLAWTLGRRFDAHEAWMLVGRSNVALFLLEYAVMAAVFIPLTLFFYRLVEKRWSQRCRSQKYREASAETSPASTFFSSWRRIALFLGSAWLPWWLFLMPGQITMDSATQIRQALGLLPYTDHHPIAMTALMGLIIAPLRALTGSTNFALAMWTLLQLAVLAVIFARMLIHLHANRTPLWVLQTTIAFLVLHPMIGWYSVTVWKDVWLGALLALLSAVIVRILTTLYAGEKIPTVLWWEITAVMTAVGLSKKTGIYILIPVAVVFIAVIARFWSRAGGEWKNALRHWVYFSRGLSGRALGSAVLACIIALAGQATIHRELMMSLEATPGSPAEAYSLPSQHIARIVRDHGPQLTDADKADIEWFYPGADLAALYRANLADPVKGAADPQRLTTDSGRYIALWFRLSSRHPATALEATLVGTRGYWYPGTVHTLGSTYDWDFMVGYLEMVDGVPPAELDPKYAPEEQPISAVKNGVATLLNTAFREVPVLSVALSLGWWSWIILLISGALWVTGQREKGALPVLTLAAMVWITCLLSPVHAEARYAYPLLLLIPVLLSCHTAPASSQTPRLCLCESCVSQTVTCRPMVFSKTIPNVLSFSKGTRFSRL
ncbi:MAG: DUF6020 family protein [Actinomycetaceae bacterium]|nr:DUF6020 family protein [Actinomycetaceae bacterium]